MNKHGDFENAGKWGEGAERGRWEGAANRGGMPWCPEALGGEEREGGNFHGRVW